MKDSLEFKSSSACCGQNWMEGWRADRILFNPFDTPVSFSSLPRPLPPSFHFPPDGASQIYGGKIASGLSQCSISWSRAAWTHTHTNTRMCTHTHTQTHIQACTYTHTHMHIGRHTCMHTHTDEKVVGLSFRFTVEPLRTARRASGFNLSPIEGFLSPRRIDFPPTLSLQVPPPPLFPSLLL